jgi:capsular exopolysaccharide synthesis family protein
MQPPDAGGPAAPAAAGPKKSFDLGDIKQIFYLVVRRIWIVALCFTIAIAVTVVSLSRQVPVYRSTCSLFLSKGLPIPAKVKQEETEMWGDYMETQIQLIRSGTLIARARERVGRPAEEVSKKLVRAYPEMGWKTSFLYVRAESTDPVFAAEFANALAEEYLAFKAEERMDTQQATAISLTQQANRLREELKKADERVLMFEKENNVVALQERGNIAAKFLASLASQAAAHRTSRMLLEAQQPMLAQASDDIVLGVLATQPSPLAALAQPSVAGAGAEGAGGVVTEGSMEPGLLIERDVLSSPGWMTLKRKHSLLEMKLNDLRTKFRDQHPAVIETIAQITETEKALDIEVQFALRQFYASLEALSLKEQAARKAEKEWESDALEVSRKALEYANLKKDVGRLTSLYDLLFNRLKEVDVSLGIEPEYVRIMEKAAASYTPVTPRKMQSIMLAALLGLGVGLGLIFGIEFLDDSLRFPEEVTRELRLRFLGVVPSAHWDPVDLRTHMLSNIDQKSGLAEAYRNVRSAMLFSPDTAQFHTLAVTSAVPREGKTTTSVNIALSLAQAGFRVLLVDGDMRRGELHKFFGLEGGRGFSDVLTGQVKPDAAIQRTGLERLDMVATGPFPDNPAELLLRGEFKSFMEFARRTYDRVVIDCPPVMVVTESAVLASLADITVLVVWAGKTSRKLCQLSMQTLRERGARMAGCVLNNLEFGRVGYYYAGYYGYYDYDYGYEGGRSRGRKPHAPGS